MRDRLRVLAGAFLLLLLEGTAAVAQDIVLVPRRLSAHCWLFEGAAGMASPINKGFMSNAGFVVTADGVVVFDALGTPALGEAMVAAIRKVTRQPLRRVIVSHYHADHVYGLQALKAAGAEVWAQRKAGAYLASDVAVKRLEQRREALFPWVDATTRLVPPDVWIDGDTDFRMGGVTFRLLDSGGAHSPEDLMMEVVEDRVLFVGDIVFAGRVPFVGDADSRSWLAAIGRLARLQPQPRVFVPGHGAASREPGRDFALTGGYLAYLRETMGRAVRDMETFDAAYAATDWSRYAKLPAFDAANRANAYGAYLRMEQEALDATKP